MSREAPGSSFLLPPSSFEGGPGARMVRQSSRSVLSFVPGTLFFFSSSTLARRLAISAASLAGSGERGLGRLTLTPITEPRSRAGSRARPLKKSSRSSSLGRSSGALLPGTPWWTVCGHS